MVHTTETRPAATGAALGALRGTQVLATLTVLNLLSQFLTAGTMIGRFGSDDLEGVHAGGAIVLHVLSGLTAIGALALWRLRGAALWPGVLAAVVFVLSFVQAYYGSGRTLYIHVPGAMILTVGAVTVMVWAFTSGARERT